MTDYTEQATTLYEKLGCDTGYILALIDRDVAIIAAALEQAAQPVWSEEKPKEDGWYWYRNESSPILLVAGVRGGRAYFESGGSFTVGKLDGQWARCTPPREGK